MEYVLAAAVLAAVAWFVTAPLRAHGPGSEPDPGEDPRVAELEARKEAKYREIRDAELDHAAGKLSDADFHRQDTELRREAVAILKELDEEPGRDERESLP